MRNEKNHRIFGGNNMNDFDKILEKMYKLKHKDPETAHIEADKLLIEVLDKFTHDYPIIKDIIDSWDCVTKWYA